MSVNRTNKLKLLITGSASAPALYTALELAAGVTGNCWNRIIVIGSSEKDERYQSLGGYNTLLIPKDAMPQRYTELVNLCAICSKDVIIFSSLSDEWQYGVQDHLNASWHIDVLQAHRTFLQMLRHAPVHIIACMTSRNVFLQKDHYGKRRLRRELIIQQSFIEDQFDTVLRLDKQGKARALKDDTKTFDADKLFKPNTQHGTLLYNGCKSGAHVISPDLQSQIDNCNNLAELYKLLFDLDVDDLNIITAFTRRKLQLDEAYKDPTLDSIPGGKL